MTERLFDGIGRMGSVRPIDLRVHARTLVGRWTPGWRRTPRRTAERQDREGDPSPSHRRDKARRRPRDKGRATTDGSPPGRGHGPARGSTPRRPRDLRSAEIQPPRKDRTMLALLVTLYFVALIAFLANKARHDLAEARS